MAGLAGRVAVVTGASAGIGAGLAEMLAAEGATVVLAARRETELAGVADGIRQRGGVAIPVVTDLTSDESMARLLATARAEAGPVDVLVNNAGYAVWKPLEETASADWDPALLGPAVAAVLVTAWTMGRPGIHDLLARMARWRVPPRWWLAALSPAAFLGLALIAMAAAGKPLPGVADFGRFSGIPAIGLAGVLLLITVGALGEETGWRGYALPQLQRRFSPLTSSLIIAVLWFGWHLPQFFVIATYRDSSPA
jgi:NAD(P)-dependent dehydrogenase (short-subunit alcohol dehydrogenase family)